MECPQFPPCIETKHPTNVLEQILGKKGGFPAFND